MRMHPREQAGRVLISAALLGMCCVVATGCSDAELSALLRNSTGPGPANIPLPSGQWEAIGKVLVGGSRNEPVGTVLKRPWTLKKNCGVSCATYLFRWTLYGPSETRLEPHGRFFIAKFPPVRVPCAYPTRGYSGVMHAYGESHDVYEIRRPLGRTLIHAIEHQVQTGCYKGVGAPSWTSWWAVPNRFWHGLQQAGSAIKTSPL